MENKGGGTQVPNNVVGNQCVDRRWWVHLCGQHRGGINQGGENLVVGTRAYSAWPGRTEYSYTITKKAMSENFLKRFQTSQKRTFSVPVVKK